MADTISIPMYGSELLFYPNSHRYKFGGEWLPGVTTIIGKTLPKNLAGWAANCAVDHILDRAKLSPPFDGLNFAFLQACAEARKAHERIRDEAGDIGHLIHLYARGKLDPAWIPPAEDSDDGKKLAEHPQAVRALMAFEQWRHTHEIKPPSEVERIVMSLRHRYCGTCDFFGWINGRLCVLDFKTGNDVWNEAWYQLGGYEIALREELAAGLTGIDIWHVVIHLNKNTGEFVPCWRSPEEAQRHKLVWLSLVGTHGLLKQMPEMPRAKRRAA